MNMYSSLESEFSKPMQNVGLDFKNEYLKALKSFDGYNFDVDERHQAIKGVLQRILDRYSETPAKTKGGRFGRFLSRIGAVLLKVINFKINK